MSTEFPHGHHSLTPYFTVEDADRLIAFLTKVFGGNVVKEDRYDDGRVQHARVRIGDSLIMLNQAGADYPANASQMHLYVDDVESVYRNALVEGAVSLMEPNRRPHGDQMAGFRDPTNNTWWIASPS